MKEITKCRACESKKLTEFLDLGQQYLSDFRDDDTKPPQYPLVAVFCEDCKLVQLRHTTPQNEMYHDRYGFKSGISESIKADLNDNVNHALKYNSNPETWLDIASNDGTLLSFVPKDVHKVGVDPVTFLCKEAEQLADKIINNYFDAELFMGYNAADGRAEYEQFDIVTSISCFYDMPNPNKFVDDVKKVMGQKSVWIIQQNYLLTTLELSAVDNFCHEHLEYYTLLSLENLLNKYGLEVNDVLLSSVNGGSIRTVVSRKGSYPISYSVAKQRSLEAEVGLDNIKVYRKFAKSVNDNLNKLRKFVIDLKRNGKTVVILAASTRGATIWQSTKLDAKQISYAVERNTAKVGKNFSAIGVPIMSEGHFEKDMPDYAIIGPWFFADQFYSRYQWYLDKGGHLVMPLPELLVI